MLSVIEKIGSDIIDVSLFADANARCKRALRGIPIFDQFFLKTA